MRTYGRYCPLARAAELLADRWTLIIVRNLLAGCRTFGELRAAVQAMAERAGLLEIDGARPAVRAFLACVRPSPFAHVAPAGRP